MKLLYVDGNDDDAVYLKASLRRQDVKSIELVRARTMADAVNALKDDQFDVILLELNLPDSMGQDSVHRIQSADPGVPIVVLSSNSDEEFAVEILNRGAQDYIVKREEDGRAIPRARRANKKIGVLFLDLDRFKTVNDTLGHQAGDALLGLVVERLKTCVRSGDLLARLGGDEFALMLEDSGGPLALEAAATKILSVFKKPFEIGPRRVSITASVGITVYPNDTNDPMALLNNADMAMYQAKDTGRNNFKFFTQEMHEEIIRYHQLETDLGKALQRSEFTLVYQPQIGLEDGRVHGLEALLRWEHPERGLVMLSEFISVAEESGHIVPIGIWVLERVCRQIRDWQSAGEPVLRVAINVAPANFEQPDFHRQVEAKLARYEIDPGLIELEVTEGTLMANTERVVESLHRLKSTGVRLSVDDFGTGHSCLSYLRQFPIDVLKIDRSFVMDLGRDEHGTAICGLVLSIARSLDLEVVAEGVENLTQLEFLKRHNCEYVQGQYFSMPVPPTELPDIFAAHGTSSDGDRLSQSEVFKALAG